MAEKTDPTKEPRAVAVNVLKGGFGKSTTAINLARELADRNGRVLLVDLDDNGHTTFNLGYRDQYESDNHVQQVLLDDADPLENVVQVTDNLDLFPSHEDLEEVETNLKSAMASSQRLGRNIVDPLLGDTYSYIVVDTPANRGKLNDNALFATKNLIVPLRPESGWESGITQTNKRLIQEARQYFDLELLALVPTDLSERLDQDTRDRNLLYAINSRDELASFVPNFAHLSAADWEAIDAGDYTGDLPGIRHRASIDKAHRARKPLRDYDAECDQLGCYEELAQIVENGGVVR
ncbi:ParA family protein [Natronococcus sp. A-GB7]|uniref:ParA family protein n=1 Tax=Natronococcus sp. A-GB7 TaxID=3037649 RepID=UPI00241E1707|nr:ParA family protein [Natronococcus sp. A-GB7]MDG5821661.1 ParA family protein [Natronococcus sp. A-GB7]